MDAVTDRQEDVSRIEVAVRQGYRKVSGIREAGFSRFVFVRQRTDQLLYQFNRCIAIELESEIILLYEGDVPDFNACNNDLLSLRKPVRKFDLPRCSADTENIGILCAIHVIIEELDRIVAGIDDGIAALVDRDRFPRLPQNVIEISKIVDLRTGHCSTPLQGFGPG
ncbi:MAG: hypothetical protein ACJ8CZ_06020 [Microvirga sp.]